MLAFPHAAARRAASVCVAIIVTAIAAVAALDTAAAYDDNVEKICAEDYRDHCSQHEPNSPQTRYCMEAHRDQLTRQCVKALVEAGLVPKKYLSRKLSDGD